MKKVGLRNEQAPAEQTSHVPEVRPATAPGGRAELVRALALLIARLAADPVVVEYRPRRPRHEAP